MDLIVTTVKNNIGEGERGGGCAGISEQRPGMTKVSVFQKNEARGKAADVFVAQRKQQTNQFIGRVKRFHGVI